MEQKQKNNIRSANCQLSLYREGITMSKILIDGTSFYQADAVLRAFSLKKYSGKRLELEPLTNIIYGFVLWDDIYIGYTPSYPGHVLGLCQRYDIACRFIDLPHAKGHLEEYCDYESAPYEEKQAIRYLIDANAYGLDYLPSVERQRILEHSTLPNLFSRRDVLDQVDSELQKYYERVNQHLPRRRIQYDFPVLIDYLIDKYSTSKDVFRAALDLKHNPIVEAFRKEMDCLEAEFRNGNVKYLDEYFSSIGRMIEYLSETHSSDEKIKITVETAPVLSSGGLFPVNKPFQCVFLKDLSYYGITSRKPK